MNLFLRWWNKREKFRNVFWRGSRAEPDVAAILADLRQFCRADTPCVYFDKEGRIDTHMTALLEGRREVFLRIVSTLQLSDTELQKMKEIAEND